MTKDSTQWQDARPYLVSMADGSHHIDLAPKIERWLVGQRFLEEAGDGGLIITAAGREALADR